jgi:hypothetical protein
MTNDNRFFGVFGSGGSSGATTALTDGSGTTANGTAIDLGGALDKNAIITGGNTHSIFLGQDILGNNLTQLQVNATSQISSYLSAFGGGGVGVVVAVNPAGHTITNNVSGNTVVHTVTGSSVQSEVISGTITSEVNVTTQEVQMKYDDNGVGGELNLSLLANIFTDNTASNNGIVYASDYSATFVPNSLVTKAYVDGALSSAPNFANADLTLHADRTHNLNGNNLIFDASSTGNVSIQGSTSNNYRFLENISDGGASGNNSTRFNTSQGGSGIHSWIDNYYENTTGTDIRTSRLTLFDTYIGHLINRVSGGNTNTLDYRYQSQLTSNDSVTLTYQSRFSRGYIQRLNIGGTYSATDYYRITTGLNYVLDTNNLIGFNVGIGTGDNPNAKLTVDGDVILNGLNKIGSEDISLLWDFRNDGNLIGSGKRITNTIVNPTVQETTSAATFTINADEQNTGVLTAQAAALTVANPTGTIVQGQKLVYRIKDDGTGRAITWGADFRAIGVTLPTTTTASKLLYVGCLYNSTDSKWDVIAVKEEA